MSINRSRTRSTISGFTLVELVIFIVIVGVAVAGILQVMSVTAKSSTDPQIRKQALSIAEALLEEVSLAPFTYCDAAAAAGCSVENGQGVDSRLKINSGNSVAINDINSNPIPSLNGYTATISVNPAGLNGIASTDALHIIVSVTNGPETIRLDGYRARYAPGTTQ